MGLLTQSERMLSQWPSWRFSTDLSLVFFYILPMSDFALISFLSGCIGQSQYDQSICRRVFMGFIGSSLAVWPSIKGFLMVMSPIVGSSKTKTLFLNIPDRYFYPLKQITPELNIIVTLTMLHPLLPGSPIIASIVPDHLTLTMTQIIKKLAFVNVARTPFENTIATFSVVLVHALVLVTTLDAFMPSTLAVSQTAFECSFEDAPVAPNVLTLAVGFTTFVLAFVCIAIRKFLNSVAMFQELLKLALVFVAVDPNMNTIAISLVISPLTNISITFWTFPHTISVDQTILKLTNVNLFTWINECSIAMWFRIHKIPNILGSRCEFEVAFTHFEVQFEEAFIDGITSNQYTHAMTHIVRITTKILVILPSNNREISLPFQILLRKVILLQPIIAIH